ncbi:helix-hairpin-helix repeat-containing competence protein ComEA [Kamptonema sp. PCC 6506]|nr:helix-hairpin-helix repeat-containing competence protein ComEA [Kamptonema sp. PCC 6506]
MAISLAACHQRGKQIQLLTPRLAPLPQDPLLQVYFNQSESSLYKEFYREQTRYGDDFEKLIADAIAGAQLTVDVAVQELRLPAIARAMAQQQAAGVRVRAIVENTYSRPWSGLTKDEVRQLPQRERDRYSEFIQLADADKDGNLNQAEVVDGKSLIVTSANFTPSDIHGDFGVATSRGNLNNLLKIESGELAQLFTQEFNMMWGDGPGGKPDSKFGIKKPLRSVQQINLGNVTVAVQFSPTAKTVPWEKSSNGLIDRTLANARKSVNLALFVFSAQRLVNTLEYKSQAGVAIRGLIDPSFAYRSYSEGLDMMGVALLDNCQFEAENRPWQKPIATMGVPQLQEGDRLHHKFGVVDGKIVITGSHNWTEAANYGNDEALLVIESETVAAHFEREFERLYQNVVLGLPRAIAQKIEAQKQLCAALPKSDGKMVNAAEKKLVNLNVANQAELETLPGVGPKLAQKIIAARKQQPFSSLEDLDRVPGVGKKMLERWRDRVTW